MARSSVVVPAATSSTLLLSGGGTGGHVYPALSVAAALVAAGEERPLVYVGSVGGMEEGIVGRESSLPFRGLPAAALRGRGPVQMLRGVATMVTGSLAARRLIGELRPAAILGTGGYVCVPLFIAARLLGVPTMIYLPDVVPGLAVRFLSRIATVTAVNVEDSRPHLPRGQRAVVTGYPVRAELFGQDRDLCRRAFGLDDRLPVLLVYGGSRGARSLNQAIKALLPHLLDRCQIIHVCGREGDAKWLEEAAAGLKPEQRGRYRLYPYLEAGATEAGTPAMTSAFGAADLAICRSGASTLAELPAAGLPAVLVPYPYVHQDENADYLVRHGAAVKVADSAMLGDGTAEAGPLAQAIFRVLSDTPARQQMAAQSRALARPQAASDLAAVFRSLATRSASR